MPNLGVSLEDFDELVRPKVKPIFDALSEAEKQITALGQAKGNLEKVNGEWDEFNRTFLKPNFEFSKNNGKASIKIRPEAVSAIENADEIMRTLAPDGGASGDGGEDFLSSHEKEILGLVGKNFVSTDYASKNFITVDQANQFAEQQMATMRIGFKIRDFQKELPELSPEAFIKFATDNDLAGSEKQIESAFKLYKEQTKQGKESKENLAADSISREIHAAAGKVGGSPDGSAVAGSPGDIQVEKDPEKRRKMATESARKIFSQGQSS